MNRVKTLLEDFQTKKINVDYLMTSLINNFVLVINNEQYEFSEIELYYYKKGEHQDCIVLQREHKQASDIFFHRYGFDICFTSLNDEYGGILVRSLKKDNNFIVGSLRCSHHILNQYQPNIRISIEYKQEQRSLDIIRIKRVKSECTKKDHKDHNNSLYRFITKELYSHKEHQKYLKNCKLKTGEDFSEKHNENWEIK